MLPTNAYAAQSRHHPFSPFYLRPSRTPNAHDVQIEILYCGVCHSDIHQARNEWGGSTFPDGARSRNCWSV
jgi:uncharacterized zinc-type alcohol dehydrogenase-like protein